MIAARAWGPADGRPVLALHGWLDNAASFDRLIPLLDPTLRVVAVDLSGHGLSDHRPAGASYPFIDWVIEVGRIAQALAWKRFSIIGHSMGAGIASLVAGTIPERVERAVLIEGLGPMTAPDEEAPTRLAQALGEKLRGRSAKDYVYPSVQAAAARLRAVSPTLSETGATLLAERGTKPTEDGYTWRSDYRLRRTSVRLTEKQALAFLGRIDLPVLIIWAEQGWPFDMPLMNHRVSLLRQHQVVKLPGGHHLHLDDPAPCAAVIDQFFKTGLPLAKTDA
jgi:pimeloyl-ACP methyl ester carboxylesterase